MSEDWYNEEAQIRDWYKLNDVYKEGHTPAIKISIREATKVNQSDYGIFWTVNDFGHEARKKANLKRVLCIAVDIDGGDKESQRIAINKGPTPSLVVESKSGYHVYYNLFENDLNADEYRAIIKDHIIDHLHCDPNAADACRILRVPNFNHWKNPNEPYLIKAVFISNFRYSVKQLKKLFPMNEERKRQRDSRIQIEKEAEITTTEADSIFTMNQMEALQRISGSDLVRGEIFTFKRNANGNYNIYSNGGPTPAFIDKNGFIGSSSGGGPTVYQWIRWYKIATPKQTMDFLKTTFKEKFKNEE